MMSALFGVTTKRLEQPTYIQGGPIKTTHFLRYHIFAATIITRFFSEVFRNYSRKQLDGHGRARREAARHRKCEWKVNLGN